jgi:hypothetical protein
METPMQTSLTPGSAFSSQLRFRVTCALIPLGGGDTARVLAHGGIHTQTAFRTQQGISLD